MGLRLVANPTFKGHADITVAGEEKQNRISIVWKHKTLKQVGAWFEANKTRTPAESMVEIIESWDGPTDEADQPVPFSVDALEQLLDTHPASGGELVAAWLEQLTESRAKNSKALSGN